MCCISYIIIACSNESCLKRVQSCLVAELGSFALHQKTINVCCLKSCCLCISLLTQTSESKTTRKSQATRSLKSLKSLVKPCTTLSSSPDFSSIFLLLSSDSCTNKQKNRNLKSTFWQPCPLKLWWWRLQISPSSRIPANYCKPHRRKFIESVHERSNGSIASLSTSFKLLFTAWKNQLPITANHMAVSPWNTSLCLNFQACLKLFDNELLGGLQKQWGSSGKFHRFLRNKK